MAEIRPIIFRFATGYLYMCSISCSGIFGICQEKRHISGILERNRLLCQLGKYSCNRWSESPRGHGGPSEAGDCSHPPPKMATAENPTSGKATFDHVIGTGSLRFLACEQVLDIANPWYSNGRSSRDSLASQGTRIFQREAGDSIERGG